MTLQFKNKIATSDTTGSKVVFFTCPAGKTVVFKTIHLFNNDTNNVAQTTYILDHSNDSSNSYALGSDPDTYTINAGGNAGWTLPIILEENDQIQFQSDQDNQHFMGSYVEMDNASYTRFRHITKKITSEDAYTTIFECPTGSTCIIRYWQLHNLHGSNNATANILAVVEQTTNTYVYLAYGTINSSAGVNDATRTYVLESGDRLRLQNTEQPFTVTVFYQEIRNPAIRGQ